LNVSTVYCKTKFLPVVLYGCDTWSLTLREERRLRLFENKVLRRIFGPYRDEVTGEWRRLHNEELNDLYSPNIVWMIKSRRIRWAGRVARYGYDTWSLTLREERRLRFENKVLRRIFGPYRDEVTGEWRRLHNEELNEMYSPNIVRVIKSRRMRWVGRLAHLGEGRGLYRVLVGKPEGKRPHGRQGVDGRIILR